MEDFIGCINGFRQKVTDISLVDGVNTWREKYVGSVCENLHILSTVSTMITNEFPVVKDKKELIIPDVTPWTFKIFGFPIELPSWIFYRAPERPTASKPSSIWGDADSPDGKMRLQEQTLIPVASTVGTLNPTRYNASNQRQSLEEGFKTTREILAGGVEPIRNTEYLQNILDAQIGARA